MIRGENNCAQHRSKGTTLDTDEGETTPKVLCKGPEKQQGRKKSAPQWDVWAFLAARGLLTTQISRIKLHNTHARGKRKKNNNKEEVTSKFELWGLTEHQGAWQQHRYSLFFFFYPHILFVHAWYNITASNMFFIQRRVYQSDRRLKIRRSF